MGMDGWNGQTEKEGPRLMTATVTFNECESSVVPTVL